MASMKVVQAIESSATFKPLAGNTLDDEPLSRSHSF